MTPRRLERVGRALASAALFSMLVLAGGALAESASKGQMQSLDEQVQDIKSDVLAIAAELSLLEEKLLFPSGTQVVVFVSLSERERSEKEKSERERTEKGASDTERSRLDSVQITIDGEPVAHHIYSFKELEALQRGGVQRIYTGNLPTGTHEIHVHAAGKLANGNAFDWKESFAFEKQVEPKLVDISLGASKADGARIRLAGR